MLNRLLFVCLLFASTVSVIASAQSSPAAEGPARSVWVGVELSSFNPDWGCKQNSALSCWDRQLQGITVVGDGNRLLGKIGVEGEARFLYWNGPEASENEINYLVGPRYQVFAGRRWAFNAKVLAGEGIFQFRSQTSDLFAYAAGGTVGYRMTRKLQARADYEYQVWPNFVGPLGPHGLTPNGFSVGVNYLLFR